MSKTSNLRSKMCDCGNRYNFTKGEPSPMACKDCLQKQIDRMVQFDIPPSWEEFEEFLRGKDEGLLPLQREFAKSVLEVIEEEPIINKPKGSGKTFVYNKIAEYLKTK